LVDAAGLVLAYAQAGAYSRHSRAAALGLLPWLVWMLITTALKAWLLVGSD